MLIRDEADRIRGLVDRMEMFGEKPIARGAVNIHRVLEHVRKLAQSGFAAHVRFQENYDPSLPPWSFRRRWHRHRPRDHPHDRAVIKLCPAAFEAVWRRAIDHKNYRPA